MKTAKKFNLDINLDDEQEANSFVSKHGGQTGKQIAASLNLQGEEAEFLCQSLLGYAKTKLAAINKRENGFINSAIDAEEICDSIYNQYINPVCDCW